MTKAFDQWRVMAMITPARHSLGPGDVALDHEAAGLRKPCVVGLKVFTIDNRLIRAALGALSPEDAGRLAHELRMYFPCPQAAGKRATSPSPS